jgi:hypothetical protein
MCLDVHMILSNDHIIVDINGDDNNVGKGLGAPQTLSGEDLHVYLLLGGQSRRGWIRLVPVAMRIDLPCCPAMRGWCWGVCLGETGFSLPG